MIVPVVEPICPIVPAGTSLPLAVGPNWTSAVPIAGVVASGALTETVQSLEVFWTQLNVTVWAVPRASYTVMSEEIGDVVVPVPEAGVAGRLAERVTFAVATGFNDDWATWIGASAF